VPTLLRAVARVVERTDASVDPFAVPV